MAWELIRTDNVEWIQDDSGFNIQITVTQLYDIRVDVMQESDNMPLISFVGDEHGVRIALMRWLSDNMKKVSLERAAYIGRELFRADLSIDEGMEYVQE